MAERTPPRGITQVVSDGVYLYALCSDNTLWKSLLEFPLAWTQLASVPKGETVESIGVTLGAVHALPDEVLFAVTARTDTIYFFDGSVWTQRFP